MKKYLPLVTASAALVIIGGVVLRDLQARKGITDSVATVGNGGVCEIDWSRAYGANPSNIDPELKRLLCVLSEQTGTKIIPNAGYRTVEEQTTLGDELIAENPGYYRDSDGTVRNAEGRLVAETPNGSDHVAGRAVDINRNGVSGEFYTEEELKAAGLTASGFDTGVRGEPWHIVIATEKGDIPL